MDGKVRGGAPHHHADVVGTIQGGAPHRHSDVVGHIRGGAPDHSDVVGTIQGGAPHHQTHDRVCGHHYPESGGKSPTAYIISQRNEIEGLRAAGAYVDADIMAADLRLFIWSLAMRVCAGHCHHHGRAGLKPVH